MIVNKIADDWWIRTADLWCLKAPLYQLRHNRCPGQAYFAAQPFCQNITTKSALTFSAQTRCTKVSSLKLKKFILYDLMQTTAPTSVAAELSDNRVSCQKQKRTPPV